MHLAIRADGGPAIGYGHLVRSGALAGEFLDRGHEVTYATQTPASVEDACPDGVAVRRLDEPERGRFIEWLEEIAPDAVLTDSYSINTDYQAAIRDVVPVLAVVLDDTRYTVCADVLINGNVYAPDLEYEWVGNEPSWCLGTDYLLIRRAFSERARRDPPWRDPPERGLVTMGGSDVRDATPAAMRAFSETNLEIDIIVGPGFSSKNRDVIRATAENFDGAVELRHAPSADELAKIMFEADVAVSATGTTVYELLAVGTPTIGIPQSENQVLVADSLEKRNVIRALDRGAPDEQIRGELGALLADVGRRSLQAAGRDLVDGRGTGRLMSIITRRVGV